MNPSPPSLGHRRGSVPANDHSSSVPAARIVPFLYDYQTRLNFELGLFSRLPSPLLFAKPFPPFTFLSRHDPAFSPRILVSHPLPYHVEVFRPFYDHLTVSFCLFCLEKLSFRYSPPSAALVSLMTLNPSSSDLYGSRAAGVL